MNQITKTDLMDRVRESVKPVVSLTKKEASAIVNAVFEEIATATAKDTKVSILGFGSFEPVDVNEREGRNPRTGETCMIPKHKRIKFKASKSLNKKANE